MGLTIRKKVQQTTNWCFTLPKRMKNGGENMQEKENMFAWAKTLLSVYKYIETVTAAIDNLVLKQGVHSCFYSNGFYNATFQTANNIIELTNRKQTLINLKLMVEDGLAKLPKDDVRLLVLTYFDLLKSTLVSERLGVSIRTFFRKKQFAIGKFANALKFMGFTHEKLLKSLQGENWLLTVFENNTTSKQTQNQTEEVETPTNEYRLLKYIMKDLNQTAKRKFSYQ